MATTVDTTLPQETAQAIAALLDSEFKAEEPGTAVLVARHGQALYRGGRGLAHVELGVPIAPHMIFRLGSITKQFTAVALLMLVQEGRVSLEDEITRYLPEYPTQGHRITVEHVLTHTSGIKSYTGMPEFWPQSRRDVSLDELIAFFKDQPMEFAPGERWNYNNSAYILAGAVIEKVTGQPYGEFVAQRICDPLGMTHTSYDQTSRLVPGRVAGYQRGTSGFENAAYLSMTWPHAAGALMSSVDNLLLWDEALYTDRLLPRTLLERAFTSARLNDGTATGYGLGWMVGTYNGHRTVSHGGGIHGFITHALRLPDEHLFVAVLMNAMRLDVSPSFLAVRLAGLALGEPFQQPQAVSLAPDVLEAYTGVYEQWDATTQTVTRDGDTLFVQSSEGGDRAALVPLAEGEFVLARDPLPRLRFPRDAAGAVSGLEVHNPLGGPVALFARTTKPLPTTPA